MSARAVAVAQWRVAPDHAVAADAAMAAGTSHVQLDIGGAGRGPRLDDDVLDGLRRRGVVVDALAVNQANDLGLHRDGRPCESCMVVLEDTIDLALRHGVPAVHVPIFRSSTIEDEVSWTATVEVLARCARRAGPDVLVLTESALDVDAAVALRDGTGEETVRVVADTGNLLDLGQDPLGFVEVCRAAHVLAPAVHLKVPGDTPDAAMRSETCRLLGLFSSLDVLLENDYRGRPDRLAADVAAAHDLPPAPLDTPDEGTSR